VDNLFWILMTGVRMLLTILMREEFFLCPIFPLLVVDLLSFDEVPIVILSAESFLIIELGVSYALLLE
jgi:hypothetical protein